MCYSVAYLEKKLTNLVNRYASLLPPGWKPDAMQQHIASKLPAYYFVSGFSHPKLPVIIESGISLFSWGLIPFWVKSPEEAAKLRSGTLNAVGETVFKKPSFRGSIRQRRCLLPVSGFFEWREYLGKKYPYYIQSNDGMLLSLGGIYDEWTNPESGEVIRSFSIITTAANALLEVIHNRKKRMPLILEGESEKQWIQPGLDAEDIQKIIKPFDQNTLTAHTVSRALNFSRNERNIPEATELASYPELPELPSLKN